MSKSPEKKKRMTKAEVEQFGNDFLRNIAAQLPLLISRYPELSGRKADEDEPADNRQ